MANHPNRGWRRRMHEACEVFLARWRWPAAGSGGMLAPDEMRAIMAQAYQAGYADGRESTNRRQTDDKPAT